MPFGMRLVLFILRQARNEGVFFPFRVPRKASAFPESSLRFILHWTPGLRPGTLVLVAIYVITRFIRVIQYDVKAALDCRDKPGNDRWRVIPIEYPTSAHVGQGFIVPTPKSNRVIPDLIRDPY